MKNIHIGLFFLTVALLYPACKNSVSENEATERLEHYENGSVQRRSEMKNGKKNGKMTDYYFDGRIRGERHFKDDKQIGRTVIYFPSGKIKEVQYYTDGVQQGGDTLFYENGKLEFVTNFDQNVKNGYLWKWDTVGTLIFTARYRHDTVVEVNGDTMIKGRGPGLNVRK